MSIRNSYLICSCLSVLIASAAWSCNIPVFRYALERWPSDAPELLLFYREPLTTENRNDLERLSQQFTGSSHLPKPNLIDIGKTPVGLEEQRLWQSIEAQAKDQLPYLLMRTQHQRGPVTSWQGTLSTTAKLQLTQSTARNALANRLLNGDSIVWLVISSSEDEQTAQITSLLRKQNAELARTMELPEGIGEPGSELYSEVPLLLQFTVLEIDRNDKEEEVFVKFIAGFQPQAFQEGQALVVPVFGRGRALEVIPADQISDGLIDDVTMFLCGACSCQVKEQNPGFDLLLAAPWQEQLFEPGVQPPPPSESSGEGTAKPQLLTIPPGRKR